MTELTADDKLVVNKPQNLTFPRKIETAEFNIYEKTTTSRYV